MITNDVTSKSIGAVSGILVYGGLMQVLSPTMIHLPAGQPFWVMWLVVIHGIFSLSSGILLFFRPRTFWWLAFCAVAIQIVSAGGVLLVGFPSTSVSYKMARTLPHVALVLVTMYLLIRAKASDATSRS
jgi:hypothetical protein